MHIFTSCSSTAPPLETFGAVPRGPLAPCLKVLAAFFEVLWRRPSRSPVRRASRSIGTRFVDHFFSLFNLGDFLLFRAITTPISIQNMRFYEMMIFSQNVPLRDWHIRSTLSSEQPLMNSFSVRSPSPLMSIFLKICPALSFGHPLGLFPSPSNMS